MILTSLYSYIVNEDKSRSDIDSRHTLISGETWILVIQRLRLSSTFQIGRIPNLIYYFVDGLDEGYKNIFK